MSFILLLLLLVLSSFVSAKHLRVHDQSFAPDYALRVSYEDIAVACRYRLSAVVNGTSPGPEIRLQENRTTWIRVYNDFEADNLTIHWHGLSQSTAPFSDGTPQASQWPIPAGHFFDYELRPSIGEAGTYFYHSHVQFQAVSVAGPLIVEEASGCPPYEYADERTIFFSEVFNKTDDEITAGITASTADFIWSGYAEQLLINGNAFPAYSNNYSETPTPFSTPPNSTTPPCHPEIIEVQPSTTYRFRSIGGLAYSLTSYMFENHDNLTIIAADGSYTQPTPADGRIQIDAGQRFDYLLTTKSESELRQLNKTNFWVQLESRFVPGQLTSYAILSYVNCTHPSPVTIPTAPPSTPPLTIPTTVQTWLESTLQPLTSNDFPPTSSVSRTVFLRSAQVASQALHWTINNHTWSETTPVPNSTFDTPYLVNIYQHGPAAIPDFSTASANDGYDTTLNVYAAKVGEVIDIILINEPNGQAGGFDNHPWHIHGGHVYDLGSGQGEYNASAVEERLAAGCKPVKRDTTILFKYVDDDGLELPAYSAQGWRGWRLRVDDAGVWMVHCHTLQHMVMGMQSVWIMGDERDIAGKTQPYVSGYLEYGGSAYGNESYDPLVMHYFD
ncbi:multicopper oxidase [Myriangium duriaei CBS 260.36]|uniref:Multicopper oxidase n=1 Tax=Myriangium duriaei CBS 260.36 TaxID=1168546 RepID=A0A9P4MQ93_9PEZI|nr:multicopper oxidase [Myriangium duriaei CBS 260.36]